MKKVFLIITIIFFGLSLQAQKRNAKESLKVNGVCLMCKKRIEKAALGIKGVKFANWSLQTKQLSLIIDKRKTNTDEISKVIANVGHDTKLMTAPKEIYDNLHECCKYRKERTINHP